MLVLRSEMGQNRFFARQLRLVVAIMLGVVLFQTTLVSALPIDRDDGSAFSAASKDVAVLVRSESAEVSASAPSSAQLNGVAIETQLASAAPPSSRVSFPPRQTGPPTPPPRNPHASPRAPPAHP